MIMRMPNRDSTPVTWYSSFFSGLMVDMWLRATTDEQTRLEADFLEKSLEFAPPARLLDVPCGGGRHAHEMARRGYQVTGVDIAPEFLDAARAKDSTVQWEERDMRDLPWPGYFDGAYCLGNAFGYLEDEGNARFLKAVADALKPGGRFVLESGYIAETLLPVLQKESEYQLGGFVVRSQRHYDPANGRLYVEYTCIKDGKADKRAMSARIHTCREIRLLLEAAGFRDLQIFGGMAGEPFELGAHNLIAVAVKS